MAQIPTREGALKEAVCRDGNLFLFWVYVKPEGLVVAIEAGRRAHNRVLGCTLYFEPCPGQIQVGLKPGTGGSPDGPRMG